MLVYSNALVFEWNSIGLKLFSAGQKGFQKPVFNISNEKYLERCIGDFLLASRNVQKE